MPKCPAITRSGGSCKGVVPPGATYCVAHDPARKEERRRNARKAGRARPRGELKEVKAWLLKLASDVEEGRLDPRVGSIVSQILNVFLRSVEVERRLKETEELEERLEALEAVLKGRKVG